MTQAFVAVCAIAVYVAVEYQAAFWPTAVIAGFAALDTIVREGRR